MDVTTIRVGINAIRHLARSVLIECDALDDAIDAHEDPEIISRRLAIAARWAASAREEVEIYWRAAESEDHVPPRSEREDPKTLTPGGGGSLSPVPQQVTSWWQRILARIRT